MNDQRVGTSPRKNLLGVFQVATGLLVDVDARTASVRIPGLYFRSLFVTLILNVANEVDRSVITLNYAALTSFGGVRFFEVSRWPGPL
jgi:hypothetical protein